MLKEEYEKGKQIVEGVTLRVTLNVFRTGCDRKNFDILHSLPISVKDLEKKFNLTKMPMNKRINELEKCGLLKRDKKEGMVHNSNLGIHFLRIMEEIKEEVIKELPNLI